MKNCQKELGDRDEITIIPISDTHLGDRFSDADKLYETLSYANQDGVYIILLGDILNAELRDTVGNIYEARLNPQEELELALELFSPYKDKILGIIQGNHEMRIKKRVGIDVSKILATELGCLDCYDPVSLLLDISIGHNQHGKPIIYQVFCTHGWGGGKKTGSKLDKAKETKNIISNADIYLVAHHHEIFFSLDALNYYDKRTDKDYQMGQFIVGTGGYLSYGGYTERTAFPRNPVGSVRIVLSGRRKEKSIICNYRDEV